MYIKCIEYEDKLKNNNGKRPAPLFRMKKGLSIDTRKEFEAFLVRDCVDPIINNVQRTLADMQIKISSNKIVEKWASRINETVDISEEKTNDGDGFEFSRKYLCNLYLPFKTITITTLSQMILNNSNDKISSQFPIVYGLGKTIDTIGYFVFGIEYLPFMLLWVKINSFTI